MNEFVGLFPCTFFYPLYTLASTVILVKFINNNVIYLSCLLCPVPISYCIIDCGFEHIIQELDIQLVMCKYSEFCLKLYLEERTEKIEKLRYQNQMYSDTRSSTKNVTLFIQKPAEKAQRNISHPLHVKSLVVQIFLKMPSFLKNVLNT